MKKNLLILWIGLTLAMPLYSEEKEVIITPVLYGQTMAGAGHPRMPLKVPRVIQNDKILIFGTSYVGISIQLLQDDVIVWLDIVDENGEVILPEHLSGTYTLLFQLGSITFVGEIEL